MQGQYNTTIAIYNGYNLDPRCVVIMYLVVCKSRTVQIPPGKHVRVSRAVPIPPGTHGVDHADCIDHADRIDQGAIFLERSRSYQVVGIRNIRCVRVYVFLAVCLFPSVLCLARFVLVCVLLFVQFCLCFCFVSFLLDCSVLVCLLLWFFVCLLFVCFVPSVLSFPVFCFGPAGVFAVVCFYLATCLFYFSDIFVLFVLFVHHIRWSADGLTRFRKR